MPASAAATSAPYFESLPWASIARSPTNPRKLFQLDDLVASIREKGIRTPLVVRSDGAGGYELVEGERRHRAAEVLALETVPCEVRELDDDQVLEEQLLSFAREDMGPLDECDAYRRLEVEHEYSPDQIASRIGRPVRHVRQRLQLVALVPEVRAALVAGTVLLGVAIALATLSPAAQREVLPDLKPYRPGAEPFSVGDARHLIDRQRRRLQEAPWDLADGELTPAGACSSCPKRTGVQSSLFLDGDPGEDRCADPACFADKREAYVDRARAKAKAAGLRVIEGPAAKKLFPYGRELAYDAKDVVDLSAPCPGVTRAGAELPPAPEEPDDDASEAAWEAHDEATEKWQADCASLETTGGKTTPATWGDVIGASLKPDTVVIDKAGRAHQLVDAKSAIAALKASGLAKVAEQEERDRRAEARHKGAESDYALETKAKATARNVATVAVLDAADRKKPDESFWRFLVGLAAAGHYEVEVIAKRRGVEPGKGKSALPLLTSGLKEAQLRGLVIELLMRGGYGEESGLNIACRYYGVDLKALEKKALSDLKSAKKAKASGKGKPVAKKGAPSLLRRSG